ATPARARGRQGGRYPLHRRPREVGHLRSRGDHQPASELHHRQVPCLRPRGAPDRAPILRLYGHFVGGRVARRPIPQMVLSGGGGNRTARAETAKEKKVAASIPWGCRLPAYPVDSRYLVPEGYGRDVSHRRCCRDLIVMVPVRRRRRRRAHKRPSGGNRLERPAAFTLLTHLHFHDAPVGEALGGAVGHWPPHLRSWSMRRDL